MSLFINCPWCRTALAPTCTQCFACGATLENGQLVSPGDPAKHQEPAAAPVATPVVATPQPEPTPVVATPQPMPEPVATPVVATPQPEPEPVATPVVAAPQPEPAPVVAAPQPEPTPAPEPEPIDAETYWNDKPYLSAGDLLLALADVEAGKLSQDTFDNLKQKFLRTPAQLDRLL